MMDEDTALNWVPFGLVAATALAIGLFLWFQQPLPEPKNTSAYGCYESSMAPPILLDQDGLQILQPEFPKMGFALDRTKAGIFLDPAKPVFVERVGERFVFTIGTPKQQRSFRFFWEGPDGRHSVFDEDRLDQFSISAIDSEQLAYARTTSVNCGRGE